MQKFSTESNKDNGKAFNFKAKIAIVVLIIKLFVRPSPAFTRNSASRQRLSGKRVQRYDFLFVQQRVTCFFSR